MEHTSEREGLQEIGRGSGLVWSGSG